MSRNVVVPIETDPWAAFSRRCQRDAREYIGQAIDVAVERARDAGRTPTEGAIREAAVDSLTLLCGEVMGQTAHLAARIDALETPRRGWLARLLRRP